MPPRRALAFGRGLVAFGRDLTVFQYTAILIVIIVFMTLARRVFTDWPPRYEHLGSEYFNIARALADGRGYSDPFGERTGPTAWMPPIYPLLIAGLLTVLKSKALVGRAVILLTDVSLVLIGVIIYLIARARLRQLNPLVVMAVYIAWLCAYYDSFLTFTQDVWLIALVSGAIALCLLGVDRHGSSWGWRWGVLGGIAANVSPTLTTAWAVVSLTVGKARARRRPVAIALCIAALLGAPWVVRNAVVFGAFVPGKSNFGFDAYQASFLSEDGVYDSNTFLTHPAFSGQRRSEYSALGELNFVRHYRSEFVHAVLNNPRRFTCAVAQRFAAATAWYSPLFRDKERGLSLWMRRLWQPLPFLGCVVVLIRRPLLMRGLRTISGRRGEGLLALESAEDRWSQSGLRDFFRQLAIFYVCFLLPYIAFAFYMRYSLAITPVSLLFVLGAADRLMSAWGDEVRTYPTRS